MPIFEPFTYTFDSLIKMNVRDIQDLAVTKSLKQEPGKISNPHKQIETLSDYIRIVHYFHGGVILD